MLVMLQSVAAHGADRAAITRGILGITIRNGILGNFTISKTGDTNLLPVTIYRQAGKRLIPVKTITPSSNLIG